MAVLPPLLPALPPESLKIVSLPATYTRRFLHPWQGCAPPDHLSGDSDFSLAGGWLAKPLRCCVHLGYFTVVTSALYVWFCLPTVLKSEPQDHSGMWDCSAPTPSLSSLSPVSFRGWILFFKEYLWW